MAQKHQMTSDDVSVHSEHVPFQPHHYDRFLERIEVSRPDSRWTAEFLAKNHSNESSPIAALHFGSDGELINVAHDRGTIAGLDTPNTTDKPTRGIIAIVEDVYPNTIRYLGSRLNLDPAFFTQHLRDTRWENGKIGRPPKLPSTYARTSVMHIDYMIPVKLPPKAQYKDMYAAFQVRRRFEKNQLDEAQIRHKLSILRIEINDRHSRPRWLAVVLVDPQLGTTVRCKKKEELWEVEAKEVGAMQHFQGGYVDFTDHQMEEPFLPKKGMKNDLLFYFQHRYGDGSYSPVLAANDSTGPNLVSIGYFALKIVASQWVVTLEYTNKVASNNEDFQTGRDRRNMDIERIQALTSRLQTWRRRTIRCLRLLTDTVRMIRLHMEPQNAMHEALLQDFEFLVEGMEALKERFDTGVNIGISLIQVEEALLQGQATKESLKEAQDMKKLTNLALVFVPLSFVASLFGIEGSVSPANETSSGFWLYWAISVPLVIVVFIFAMMEFPVLKGAANAWQWVVQQWERRRTQNVSPEKEQSNV